MGLRREVQVQDTCHSVRSMPVHWDAPSRQTHAEADLYGLLGCGGKNDKNQEIK